MQPLTCLVAASSLTLAQDTGAKAIGGSGVRSPVIHRAAALQWVFVCKFCKL